MNSKHNRMLLGLLLSAGIAGASAAMAQPGHGGDHPGGGHGKGQHGAKGGARHGGPPGHDARRMPPGHGRDGPGASAYAPGHWKKGDRLPASYRDRQYYVDDWRAYRLPPPPRGHRWVGVGGDFLLISIGSGVIAQVVVAP